jgi:osmotically-inducible protein OsmY
MTCGFRHRSVSRRWQAEVLLIVLLLCGCAPHHPADDLTISTKVKIELLADPQLGPRRLDASTLDGVVTLSGTVPSQAEADRAVAAAKRVAGVRGVKSELKVGS